MTTFKSFKEIIAWQRARALTKRIHLHTQDSNFAKDFRLRDQIRSAAGSVMDNIAEGYERDGGKEFIQFLAIAKGSLGEVRSQLQQALDRAYISEAEFDSLENESIEIGKILAGLMDYIRRSGMKGIKYK